MAEAESLYLTIVANCVVNAVFSCTAIALNIITIRALKKSSSLPKPLKTLLLNLAVSDLGVGLLVQPLYVAHLVIQIVRTNKNNIAEVVLYYIQPSLQNLLAFASFLGVVTLTVDRFLAIHLNLRYQELVTHKRVVAAVTSTWLLSAILTLSYSTLISKKAAFITIGTIQAFCFIITGILYCKIYAAVRHHTNQIHAMQVQQVTQNGEMAVVARQRKAAVATFWVYVVFLACYLPLFCVILAGMIFGTVLLPHLWYYIFTLIYLNSSLNPLIYCWKMRPIRQAILVMLRKIFPFTHHDP